MQAKRQHDIEVAVRESFPERSKTGVFVRAYRDVLAAVLEKTPESQPFETAFDFEIGSS
jgi:hypothetical protein